MVSRSNNCLRNSPHYRIDNYKILLSWNANCHNYYRYWTTSLVLEEKVRHMNEQEVYNTLKTFLEETKGKKVYWRLEGSVNLFVQGVSCISKDLDISTTKEGFTMFQEILKKQGIKKHYKKEIEAEVLVCTINAQEVEIGENNKQSNFESSDKIKITIWKNLQLPTLPLPDALNFYKLINRQDKIKLIEDFLISSNSLKQEK